jgi:hypothetical protein
MFFIKKLKTPRSVIQKKHSFNDQQGTRLKLKTKPSNQ